MTRLAALTMLLALSMCGIRHGSATGASMSSHCTELLADPGSSIEEIELTCPSGSAEFAGYMRAAVQSDEQQLKKTLLGSGKAGNKNARILYTLLYTNIVDSEFYQELSADHIYSGFNQYFAGFRILTTAENKLDVTLAINYFDSAIARGADEGLLGLKAANYLLYSLDRSDHTSRDDYVRASFQLSKLLSSELELERELSRFWPDASAEALERLKAEANELFAGRHGTEPATHQECGSQHQSTTACLLSMQISRLCCRLVDSSGKLQFEVPKAICRSILVTLSSRYEAALRKRGVFQEQ